MNKSRCFDARVLKGHPIKSCKRACAWADGVFDAGIAPVTVGGKKGGTTVKGGKEYKRVIFEKVPTLRQSGR